jgi:hypothetical protein
MQAIELFSFTTKSNITVQQAIEMENLHDIFQLPLSEEAYHQYILLNTELENLSISHENDIWFYI